MNENNMLPNVYYTIPLFLGLTCASIGEDTNSIVAVQSTQGTYTETYLNTQYENMFRVDKIIGSLQTVGGENSDAEFYKVLTDFAGRYINNLKQTDPQIQKVINDSFWDML